MYRNLPLGARLEWKQAFPLSRHLRKNRISIRGLNHGGMRKPIGIESKERRAAGPHHSVMCRRSVDQREPRPATVLSEVVESALPRGQCRGWCGEWRCGRQRTHRQQMGPPDGASGAALVSHCSGLPAGRQRVDESGGPGVLPRLEPGAHTLSPSVEGEGEMSMDDSRNAAGPVEPVGGPCPSKKVWEKPGELHGRLTLAMIVCGFTDFQDCKPAVSRRIPCIDVNNSSRLGDPIPPTDLWRTPLDFPPAPSWPFVNLRVASWMTLFRVA